MPVAVVGHKADVGFVALGLDRAPAAVPDGARRGRARRGGQLRVAHGGVRARRGHARGAQRPAYLPAAAGGEAGVLLLPHVQAAGEVHNWYELPYDEREQLMYGYGGTGRTFAGRVLQLVTGPTGLDDYEWGDPVRRAPRRPQGLRLHHALRHGVVALRRVRTFRHRGRGHLDEVPGRRRGSIARLSTVRRRAPTLPPAQIRGTGVCMTSKVVALGALPAAQQRLAGVAGLRNLLRPPCQERPRPCRDTVGTGEAVRHDVLRRRRMASGSSSPTSTSSSRTRAATRSPRPPPMRRAFLKAPLPGPGSYTATLDLDSLPEGISMRDEDRATLDLRHVHRPDPQPAVPAAER